MQILLGFAVAAVGWSGFAVAQGAGVPLQPDTIIAARQAGFDLQNGVAAAMKAAVDGGQDVKPLADGAKGIVGLGQGDPLDVPGRDREGAQHQGQGRDLVEPRRVREGRGEPRHRGAEARDAWPRPTTRPGSPRSSRPLAPPAARATVRSASAEPHQAKLTSAQTQTAAPTRITSASSGLAKRG